MMKPDLADMINDAIAAKDKDGNLIATTPEMKAYANAVISTLTAGIVNHAVPGSVVGVTAAGAPLSNGAALGGIVSALIPATWSGIMQAAIPGATALSTEAAASTGYLMSASLVNFAPGNITGSCTSTPTSPGPLAAGKGDNGTIVGLAGAAWAAAVMPPGGDPTLTQAIYNAISSYIQTEAKAAYAVGSVNGICPPAAGALTAGLALAGTIT